ncbi:MAG: hypothetical protein Q9202_002295 [Teloschistes flavicans]
MAELSLACRNSQSASAFEKLPQEVHDLIFQHLSSKRQRYALLLLSKRLYHAVLPSLYRRVVFIVDSSIGTYRANYRLLRMADKENQGLLHIQELCLYVRDELSRNLNLTADYPDALVEELNLCGHSFDEHVTHLRLTDVGEGTIPKTAHQLLQSRPNIDTLTLVFWKLAPTTLNQLQGDEDNEQEHTCYKRLLKHLFAPPKQYQLSGPLSLTEMNLCGVDLNDSRRYMFPAVNFAVLKTLRVASCPGLYVMLTGMSKLPTDKKPRLRKLRIYHEKSELSEEWASDDDSTDRTLKSIDDFVRSMDTSLERMWIVMRGIHSQGILLDALAVGIAFHAASLRQLYLDVRSHQPPFEDSQCVGWFSLELWEHICARLTQLESLCVPFPPIVAGEKLNCRSEFLEYMDCALQIPSLKALNLNTWPYPCFTQIDNPTRPKDSIPYISGPRRTSIPGALNPEIIDMPKTFYEHCLSFLVQDIVKRRSKLISNPHRHLEIVGFGIPEDEHSMAGLRDALDGVRFVKSSITFLGKEEIIMKPRSWKEIQETGLGWLLDEIADIDWKARRRTPWGDSLS